MEGDAKGQVGGMEMPQKERGRLAGESRAWRCQGCGGRSNEDILKAEGGDSAKGKQTEPVIPEELKIGFRDQMKSDGEKIETTSKEKTKAMGISTSAGAKSASSPMSPQPPSASLGPTLPQSTQSTRTTITLPATAAVHMSQPLHTTRSREDHNGVPPWVDKAITGLVAALALMVFKKILA